MSMEIKLLIYMYIYTTFAKYLLKFVDCSLYFILNNQLIPQQLMQQLRVCKFVNNVFIV